MQNILSTDKAGKKSIAPHARRVVLYLITLVAHLYKKKSMHAKDVKYDWPLSDSYRGW